MGHAAPPRSRTDDPLDVLGVAVRTKRLASGQLAATAVSLTTQIYAVPAGETTILKTLSWVAPDGALTATVWLYDPAGNFVAVFQSGLVQAVPVTWHTWQVLDPGSTLRINQSANAGRLRYWASGTELEGVAD